MNASRLKCRQKNKRGHSIDGNTLISYESAIAYLNPKVGDQPMATFDNEEMRNLVVEMENEPKRSRKTGEIIEGRRLGPKTICNYFQIVKGVFDTAKDRKGEKTISPPMGLGLYRPARSEQARAKLPDT
jgi:hypothetical protein